MSELSGDALRFSMLQTAGKHVTENVSRFLRKKGKTRHELKMGVVQFFSDPHEAEVTEEAITRDGSIDGVASVDLERLVESAVVAQFIQRSNSLDPLTKLVLSTWSDEDTKRPYWFVNEDAWIRGLEGDRPKGKPQFGQFAHVSGKQTGIGKTSWAVRLAQITLRHPEYHVISNVRMTPPDETIGARLHTISRMSELVREALKVAIVGGMSLFIGDEQLFFFGRQDAMSDRVNHFDKLMKLFRKLHLSGVLVGHDFDKDLPEKSKVWFTTRFEKRALKELSAIIVTGHYKLNERVVDVPDADWPFESEHFGGMAMDVDVQHMMDWLNRQNPGSTEHERVLLLDYLDHPEWWEEDPDDSESPAPKPAAFDEFAAAEEIKANRATYFDERGRADVAAIREKFKVSQTQAYSIAKLARGGTRAGGSDKAPA